MSRIPLSAASAAQTSASSRRSTDKPEPTTSDAELKEKIELYFKASRHARLARSAQAKQNRVARGNGNGAVTDSGCQVDVKSGFVVLYGKVQTYVEKERLHRFVMGLRGVKALKDLVEVLPLESMEDREIALHVRRALDAHSELPHGTAVVHVHNGECILSGHVRTAEERHIAENVASHCKGVRSVVNEVTVDTLEESSDEATVHAVECALQYCQQDDCDGIRVSCADGVVVLRGQVPSILDRALAEEIARIQTGVKAVENHLQVAATAELQPITMARNNRSAKSRSRLKTI